MKFLFRIKIEIEQTQSDCAWFSLHHMHAQHDTWVELHGHRICQVFGWTFLAKSEFVRNRLEISTADSCLTVNDKRKPVVKCYYHVTEMQLFRTSFFRNLELKAFPVLPDTTMASDRLEKLQFPIEHAVWSCTDTRRLLLQRRTSTLLVVPPEHWKFRALLARSARMCQRHKTSALSVNNFNRLCAMTRILGINRKLDIGSPLRQCARPGAEQPTVPWKVRWLEIWRSSGELHV